MGHVFVLFFSVYGCMFSSLSFCFSTSVIDCLGRFVPEMTYYVSSGTLNLTKLKLAEGYRNRYHFRPISPYGLERGFALL